VTDPAGQGSRPICASCGEPHEISQEYCLQCGARVFPARQALQPSPLWAWATVVSLALIAIVAGVIVAILATQDGSSDAEAAPAALAEEIRVQPLPPPPAPVPVEDPTPVPTPPTTIELDSDLPDNGSPPLPLTPEELPEDPVDPEPPSVEADEWPLDASGFTVILASIPESRGRAAADIEASNAEAAGLPKVGVLDSSSFSSLRPGYWVVFSGMYDALVGARSNLANARSSGYPSAYTREVEP